MIRIFLAVVALAVQAQNAEEQNVLRNRFDNPAALRRAQVAPPVRIVPPGTRPNPAAPTPTPARPAAPPAASTGQASSSQPDLTVGETMRDIARVMGMIQARHPNTATNRELRDTAIQGALTGMDPHSVLFRPEVLRRWEESSRGSFAGVGLILKKEEADEPPVVRIPIPSSPAHGAGIRAGDQIATIDGQNTANMTLDEVVTRIRGNPGTKVRLGIRSRGSNSRAPPRQIELTRAEVVMPNIRSAMLDSTIGYIHLAGFEENSAEEFSQALSRLSGQGMRSLVIDLRDDGGGLVQTCVDIAENFLSAGQLVMTARGRAGSEEERTDTDGRYRSLKIAVLINSGSASASEILAGALRDHGRATLVGSESYGKGSVQQIFRNIPEQGYAVKLTIAKYYLPLGSSVERDADGRGGLSPDIAVNVSMEDEAKIAEQMYYRLMGQNPPAPVADAALNRAMEHLRSMAEAGQSPPLVRR